MTTLAFKAVQTRSGPTIAHLDIPIDATVIDPETDDSRFRTDRLLTEWVENNETTAWGPVDRRTVYTIGKVTEADALDEDREIVSGAGLHAFRNRKDAVKWMEQADI